VNTLAKLRKLRHGQYRATVVKVRKSTGVRAVELDWSQVSGAWSMGALKFPEIFEDFADTWWHQTDQSGDCQLRLRIESWEGRVLEADVEVQVTVKAAAVAIVDRSPVAAEVRR
jgi:hypothetical protein